MNLSEIGNIPIDFSILKSIYHEHKSISNKVCDLEKSGKIIRLKKGMFIVSPSESGKLISMELIANHLYGPSYVSMETALRFYGLIPESVYSVQSMTTKHFKAFENTLGRFEYTQCSKQYFPIGIKQFVNDSFSFLIASPEKALCDLIAYTPNLNLRFQKEILIYLEENLRLDMDAFYQMDNSVFKQRSEAGKKKNIINNILKIKQKYE